MNKTLSLVAASLITIGVGGALSPAQAQAREIDCVNYWVNPETQLAQCFDKQLNFVATPFNYFSRTINTDSNTLVRRRATGSQEMVMPNLIGLKIDAAEDYLLGLGVTLGSEETYAQNKVAGEITQQSPQPGAELTKGQSVFLKYMGATVNPLQMN